MHRKKGIDIKIPILYIGYNRPKITKKTFHYLRKAEVKNLYIVIDGPNKNKSNDVNMVSQVRNIVKKVDWECETYYRFNKKNRGAEITVSSAISWVLKREKYVIVLEDDILAPVSFLKFAQEMLIKYEDCKRIVAVTGCNFTPIPSGNDYFFAKYGHISGWGTWERAWRGYDLNVNIPEQHLRIDFLRTITNSEEEAQYYRERFQRMKRRGPGNNPWDSVWLYHTRVNNRLSIIPRVNLTSNIGTHGLHTSGKTEHHFRDFDRNFKVTEYPDNVEYNKDYDIYHYNNYIKQLKEKTPIHKRVLNKLMRMIKNDA